MLPVADQLLAFLVLSTCECFRFKIGGQPMAHYKMTGGGKFLSGC